MALIVGTNSYISLVDAQTYAAQNGLTLGANDAATETLLLQAATAMDRIYGNRYLGQKETDTQTLGWPRIVTNVSYPHYAGEWSYVTVDSFGNPRDFSGLQPETGYAQVELAALQQAGTDPYVQPNPAVKKIKEKVSSLEQDREFANAQGYQADPIYKVTLVLLPLLRASTGSIPITRGA